MRLEYFLRVVFYDIAVYLALFCMDVLLHFKHPWFDPLPAIAMIMFIQLVFNFWNPNR